MRTPRQQKNGLWAPLLNWVYIVLILFFRHFSAPFILRRGAQWGL